MRGAPVRLVREGATWWLETEVPAERWATLDAGGLHVAPRGLAGNAPAPDGDGAQRLSERGAARAWRQLSGADLGAALEDAEPGRFAALGASVFARTGAGGEPPGDAVLREAFSFGAEVDGRRQVPVGRVLADGFVVLPGLAAEVDLPPGAGGTGRVLRFATAAYGAAAGGASEIVFRLRIDGADSFEHRQPLGRRTGVEHHELALPSAARLSFEVEGPPAVAAILSPVAGSREIGSYGRRPWRAERPDLVLLLADTYRADNMEAYGGAPGVAPALDALARRSVVFANAWSPSSWTLPSHASMFTGLHPHETRTTEKLDSLPPEVETVAETLRRSGYRTEAITEQGFVSRSFGLAQGFEWFEEEPNVVEETVRRAVDAVARDDGRPLFLFVHSYRAHWPFADEEGRLPGPGDPPEEAYRRASRALDAAFGELVHRLEAAGLARSGYLVVTSDHGEAFGEHGVSGHGTGVWEEEIAVPLLLHGRDLEPRVVREPVSTIDLPQTLAHLADVAPARDWRGESLLWRGRRPPPIAVQCSVTRRPSELAVREGDLKLFLPSPPGNEPELLRLFDLAADPGELTDLLARDRARAADLLGRELARLRAVHEPAFAGVRAPLGPDDVAGLGALGYAGD